MANMYDISELSYTAKENLEWFTKAMFGGRLIQGGYIGVMTGIKGEELLSKIDINNNLLQIDGFDCAFTPNQVLKLSEKKTSIRTYKINLEQCIDELEQKRLRYQLSAGAQNDSLPADLESATMELLSIELSNEIEKLIVSGDSDKNPNEFDGMVKTLLESDESIQLAGAEITKANILDEIEAVYNAFPEEVLQAEDRGELYILGSYANRRKLRAALADVGNQTITQNWTVDDADRRNPKVYYLGAEYVPAKGIDDDTLIGYAAGNAFLLTDLLSDLESMELGNFPKPYDNKVFIRGRLRLGFVMPFEDEAVIMSTAITTDRGPGEGKTYLDAAPNSLVFMAAGETKVSNIVTDAGVVPVIGTAPEGFTATLGSPTTVDGKDVTPLTVVATGDNTPSFCPRTGQVWISTPDEVRKMVITLNQRTEDVPDPMP